VEPAGDGHVGKPKFLPGGYAIKTEAVPETLFSAEEDSNTKTGEPSQDDAPKTGDLFS
jgi:hypothetical protein